jgi:predicted amidohydrolase
VSSFTVACVQLNARGDMQTNIAAATAAIAAAARRGADLIALPENVVLMAETAKDIPPNAFAEETHAGVLAIRDAAKRAQRWVLAGTFAVRRSDGKIANRLLLVDPGGGITARYDKIHLFDVDLPDRTYRESETFGAGTDAVVADLPWLKLGLSVCYDVRFPQLYRALAKAGAGLLAVPSAFTDITGRAHWHVLLRARAIETGCFVVAPAQVGEHPGGRRTYGHALIVAPWGEILADAGEETGIVTAVIDTARIAEARGRIPALTHDRPFGVRADVG